MTSESRGGDPESPAITPGVIRVLNAAIERAMLIDGAATANAQLLDLQAGGLRIVAQSGFTTDFLEFFDLVDDTSSACGSALAAGAPVWVDDTTRSPILARTVALEVMRDAGSQAVASLPLTSPNGALIGMISTHHRQPQRWSDRRKYALQSLANSAGRLLDYLRPAPTGGP